VAIVSHTHTRVEQKTHLHDCVHTLQKHPRWIENVTGLRSTWTEAFSTHPPARRRPSDFLAHYFSDERSSAPALFVGYSQISERSPRPRGRSGSGNWRLPFERPRTAAAVAAFRAKAKPRHLLPEVRIAAACGGSTRASLGMSHVRVMLAWCALR
jgi:hypothetical protein